MAFEGDYRVYRDVLAASLRILRPHTEVETTDLKALKDEIKRFEPHVLICSLPEPPGNDDSLGWVELSLHPTLHARARIGARYSERTNPTLEELLGLLDEAELLV